jgi:hypothetical protein
MTKEEKITVCLKAGTAFPILSKFYCNTYFVNINSSRYQQPKSTKKIKLQIILSTPVKKTNLFIFSSSEYQKKPKILKITVFIGTVSPILSKFKKTKRY